MEKARPKHRSIERRTTNTLCPNHDANTVTRTTTPHPHHRQACHPARQAGLLLVLNHPHHSILHSPTITAQLIPRPPTTTRLHPIPPIPVGEAADGKVKRRNHIKSEQKAKAKNLGDEIKNVKETFDDRNENRSARLD